MFYLSRKTLFYVTSKIDDNIGSKCLPRFFMFSY
jgi:hypothetical protein